MKSEKEKKTTKKNNTAKSSKTTKSKNASKISTAKKSSQKIVETENSIVEVEEVKETKVVEKTKKSKHSLFKTLALFILLAIVLSWIIPSSYFDGATLTKSAVTRTGINEMFLSLFYSANYYLLQVVFVLIVGVFYGVLRNTNGYKTFVDKLVKFWKGKEKFFVIVNTLIISLYVSIATQSFPILLFVPLIMTIAYRLGLSKINSFLITFGSILVGMVGQTYSTFGLDYITYNMGTSVTDGVAMRFGILGIAFILLNCLIFLTFKKKDEKEELIKNDIFAPTSTKDGKALGYFLLFGIIFILMVLGYTPWIDGFKVEIFNKFHTWLTTTVTVPINGTDHAIFGYILGKINEFGKWDIFTIGYITLILLLFVKLFSRIKFDDCLDYAVEGVKKMVKPALFIVFAYSMFVISYWSGFTAVIIDKLASIGSTVNNEVTTYSFNPIFTALENVIASIFHVDFGYTGYSLSAMYAARFAEKTTTIMNIMTSMNGFTSLIAPTSVILVTGLSMYDISYKDWLKKIWLFAFVLLTILLIIFTIMTYA